MPKLLFACCKWDMLAKKILRYFFKISHQNTSVILRQNAVMYIASLIARCSFPPPTHPSPRQGGRLRRDLQRICVVLAEDLCGICIRLALIHFPAPTTGSALRGLGVPTAPTAPTLRAENSHKHVSEGISMGRGGFGSLQRGWKG